MKEKPKIPEIPEITDEERKKREERKQLIEIIEGKQTPEEEAVEELESAKHYIKGRAKIEQDKGAELQNIEKGLIDELVSGWGWKQNYAEKKVKEWLENIEKKSNSF